LRPIDTLFRFLIGLAWLEYWLERRLGLAVAKTERVGWLQDLAYANPTWDENRVGRGS